MKKVISKVFETAPYVRSRITTGDLMYFVVLALLPCAGMGIYRYGFHAALLIGISVGCAFVLEFLCDLIWKKRSASVMDYSCIVTGLVCGLILPPGAPLWAAAAQSALAIVVFKHASGGLGHNLFNPAMAAKCVLLLVCRSMMLDLSCKNYEGVSPLALLQSGETPNLLEMLTGNVAGYIGTASALAVLVVGFLRFLQAGRRLGVARLAGDDARLQSHAAALQRQKVALGAQIIRTTQQLQLKNDIFVFHHGLAALVQGVEGAGGKNVNIALLRRVSVHTDLHDSAAFFNIDKFHTVVPVQRHLQKVPRYGAGVDIKREPHRTMVFGFPQAFLVWHVVAPFCIPDACIVPQSGRIAQEFYRFCMIFWI